MNFISQTTYAADIKKKADLVDADENLFNIQDWWKV